MRSTTEADSDDLDWGTYEAVQAVPAKTLVNPIQSVEPHTALLIPNAKRLDQFPAFFARSALFRCGSKDNTLHTDLPIKAQGDYHIELSGPRLSMHDKLVYESVIQLAKANALDVHIPLVTSQLAVLKQMGWRDRSSKSLTWLNDSLWRLTHSHVSITLSKDAYSGHLLQEATVSSTGLLITFDPDFIVPALSRDLQFKGNPQVRRNLHLTLAQWLYDFLSTHSESRNLTVGYLRDISGFQGPARQFPSRLRSALDELVSMSTPLITGYRLTKGTRSSDSWTLLLDRSAGVSPDFTSPQRIDVSPSKPSTFRSQQSRRGGVAL